MKKHLSIIVLLLFNFIQLNFGQDSIPVFFDPTGIIWVVPKRADAFPVNGNWTGNSGLNLAFEDYHVIEYTFVDSFYIHPYSQKIPIYQIRIDPEYAYLENELMYLLRYCYYSFFSNLSLPYYNKQTFNGEILSTDNGNIILEFYDHYFNPTLIPSSNIRSYNKHMNLILRKYDIKSYSYAPYVSPINGDTLWRIISILCQYQDLIPLYFDLLTISHLYEYISIIPGFEVFADISLPCGPYSGVNDEVESTFKIFPNPAHNEISISGVIPESVIVYDVMGKMVVTEFNAEKNKIDIKHLPDGLYILKIMSKDGKAYSDKILKQ